MVNNDTESNLYRVIGHQWYPRSCAQSYYSVYKCITCIYVWTYMNVHIDTHMQIYTDIQLRFNRQSPVCCGEVCSLQPGLGCVQRIISGCGDGWE